MNAALKSAVLSLALLVPSFAAAQSLNLSTDDQTTLYLKEYVRGNPKFSEYYDTRLPAYFNIEGAPLTRMFDVSNCRAIHPKSRLATPDFVYVSDFDCSQNRASRSAALAPRLPTSMLPRSTVLTVNRKYSTRRSEIGGQPTYLPAASTSNTLSGQYYNDATIQSQSTMSPYFTTNSAYKRWLNGE